MADALWKEDKKDSEDWSWLEVEDKAIPELVATVPQFWEDMRALMRLMKGDKPPLKQARGKKTAQALYGFGDVFSSGFG
jgi:hypothetical protein